MRPAVAESYSQAFQSESITKIVPDGTDAEDIRAAFARGRWHLRLNRTLAPPARGTEREASERPGGSAKEPRARPSPAQPPPGQLIREALGPFREGEA